MYTKKLKGFTLVELIIVITILAILATVAFISFQGYTSNSRDSVRLSDIKNISKAFEVNKTKEIELPLPNNKVDISASGSIFQYQGELSQQILQSDLNIFNGWVDPSTKQPYGYSVNAQRNQYQIIGFLENSQSFGFHNLTSTYADNTDKYPKSSWDNLAFFLNETTQELITDEANSLEIDVVLTSDEYQVVIWDKTVWKLQSDAIIRNEILPNSSCQKIFESGQKNSGTYSISPDGKQDIQAYCHMTEKGGWTLIAVYDSLGTGNWEITSPTNFWAWTDTTTFGTTNISNPFVNVEQKYASYNTLGFENMMFMKQDTQDIILETSNCNIQKSMSELFTQTQWSTDNPYQICDKTKTFLETSYDHPFYGSANAMRWNAGFGGISLKVSDASAWNIIDDYALITTAAWDVWYIWGIQTKWDTGDVKWVSNGTLDWNNPVQADYWVLLFVK